MRENVLNMQSFSGIQALQRHFPCFLDFIYAAARRFIFFYLLFIKATFYSGRVHRQFVPVGKLLKPVLNEHVTPITCYWSLVLLLHSEDKLVRVFKVNFSCFQLVSSALRGICWLTESLNLQKVYPPVKMMVPIWKALDAFTNYGGMGNSVALQPNPLLINVEQGCTATWSRDSLKTLADRRM